MASSAPNETATAEAIQLRMAAIRRDLRDAVENISDQARNLRDWRYYFRRAPWLFAAAAAGAGFLLVPRRRNQIAPEQIRPDQALAALSTRGNVVVESMPGAARSALTAGLAYLGSLAVQAAGKYVAHRVAGRSERTQL